MLALLLACGGAEAPPPAPPPPPPPVAVGAPAPQPAPIAAEVAEAPVPDGAACPPGMVRVRGEGTLGMRADAYAIVETAHLDLVDQPEAGCPVALARHPDPAACWVQTDLVDPVVPPHPVSVDVCIERAPFPGEGARYTRDGMTPWDVQHLGELLTSGRYGTRRLCTFSELQAAVAGPRSNRRFVYGDRHEAGRCGDEAGVIGAAPGCTNPETGVSDYGAVLSHWVVADPTFVAAACPQPPCLGAGHKPLQVGQLVVAGGTGRLQTRQAPLTPHTWHDHGEPVAEGCDAMGHDDQPVICARPALRYADPADPVVAAEEAAWDALVDTARRTRSMTATLEAGLGRPVCPPAAP